MGIDWVRIEDDMPRDNGRIQKFLVCTTMKTSCFQNCDITTCYFTDRFRTENFPSNARITHWARIDKPTDLQ